jgi:hypothetical protein
MSIINNKIFLLLGYFLAITGLLFRVYSILPTITNFPFPVYWSEGGRIFAAYQVYAPIITGKYYSFPWLDPARSILDGIVLLIPHLPIWAYRLWGSLLFLIFNFLASLLTLRKVTCMSTVPEIRKQELVLPLTLWGTLFLLQGPVYYHLLAGILPVLWLYHEKRPVQNLIVVILCSIWEALCRVNWFLMPAILAVFIYLHSKPVLQKNLCGYLKWPLVYIISGGISSFSIYWIYIKGLGQVIPFLNPSMDYFFALYKLWPNAGYMGLIPGIALISLPALFIILFTGWKYRMKLHWIRLAMILCILGIFFAGSTVVSIRAGGGYDLHNYDSFLLLLFISGCFFGLDAVSFDGDGVQLKPLLINHRVLIFILVIPFVMSIPKTTANTKIQTSQSDQALMEINHLLQKSIESNIDQPILFIDQRQLQVFNMIKEDNIYIPYEKIELMEMAMARNEEYEEQFQSDLEKHKFSLIVSEKLVPWEKSFAPDFFERDWYENNVWVDYVAIPVLNYYTPIYINELFGIAVYVPKK